MTFKLESIELSSSYDFTATVNDGEHDFIAKLHFSPEKITVTIMGENYEGRCTSLGWNSIDKIVCRDMNKTFILYDLVFIGGSSRMISSYPQQIGFFESCFEVGYAIFSPSPISEKDLIANISICSTKIREWVGNTNKQEEILKAYSDKESIFEKRGLLNEFAVQIENLGFLSVEYNVSIHHSSPDFSAGISFPPSLEIDFEHGKTTKEIMNQFMTVYTLFAFYIGNDFPIDEINLSFDNTPFSTKGNLYYPSKKIEPRYKNNYSLFPLGHGLRFDSLNLPSLPLDSIHNYFSLSEAERSYFEKYLKYKRMENPEEQFLGYFRILESLCFNTKNYLDEEILADICEKSKGYLIKKFADKKNVTSFLKGIPRLNRSKYNTEKCIQDFYLKIPKIDSDTWTIKKKDIGEICKLRNDITHANNYYISSYDIVKKVKFIEILLVYALYNKLSVNLEVVAKIINRISGYHLIK